MSTSVRIGPEHGRLLLRTGRQGVAAQAGHDLTIEMTRWSGELVLADVLTESTLHVTVETGSLRVLEGTGGLKPLSERDKREIGLTARRLLDTDRQPQATFTSTKVTGNDESGAVDGTLTVRGQDRPFHLTVHHPSEKIFRATGTVNQSEYGIRPYTAMLGALKLTDSVTVEAEVELAGIQR
ncbi:polyisoprenoid-binding protein YceI [Kibdelosporangium banguiense]|uniref:Polyisoprenoid-binding protein YceI n=1 Tax=Kibdelosporangium banguiense TaxID=1365924 RepID=A0ABS4T7X1_9PSEU|nr:YceI family protein [Kibdelosporangium banguiense]MBP2320034.1 polyisoprenoid-binding protein YceI [Kibdelosporangium banguiense]